MRRTSQVWTCFIIALVQCAFPRENKKKDYEAARQQAVDAVNVFSVNPLKIRATFHLHLQDGEIVGTYEYDQISKNKYREQLTIPEMSETTIFRDGQEYSERSMKFEPLPVFYLRELIHSPDAIPTNVPISKVTKDVQNGEDINCYRMEESPFREEVTGFAACFSNANGALVRRDWRFNTSLHRFEYSNFLHDEKRIYPGTMRRFRNGTLLVDFNVESITHAPLDEKLFEPPPNANKRPECRKFQPAEADYSREYFRLRSSFSTGTVIIAGSLDDHGRMQETAIQQSADPKVDEVALKALKEIHVHPAKCDGQAIPSSFRLQMWFSPALHPDAFDSFP